LAYGVIPGTLYEALARSVMPGKLDKITSERKVAQSKE
jgi:hypothetical protein